MRASGQEVRLSLRPAEAAQALGISERKLWELSHEKGEIRAIKVGRATLYRVVDLEEFLARKAEQGGDQNEDR